MTTRNPANETQPARIAAFDWLRGLAVLVMIQTHSTVLLRPELRTGANFRGVDMLDGLVAPAFIFSAGFALALVCVRAAMAGTLRSRITDSFRRAGQVLGVATLVNVIWFPILSEPKWLLRLDILHCIGLSLLALLPMLAAWSPRPALLRWILLVTALSVFAISPFAEAVTGPASLFLNMKSGALFPLFPWAGYLFLGGSFGVTVASMKRERDLWAWLGLLLALGLLGWWQTKALLHAYPAHDFWVTNPADAARRWTLVLAVVAVLRLIERQLTQVPRALKFLSAFGTASLPAYFFHEMLLFHYRVGVFGLAFRDSVGWPLYLVLWALLCATTWACVLTWRRIEPRFTSWAARLRPSS